MKRQSSSTTLAVLMLLVWASLASAGPGQPVAVVSTLTGDVTVARPGGSTPLKFKDEIFRNDIISTPVVYEGLVYLANGQDPEHGEGVLGAHRVEDGQDVILLSEEKSFKPTIAESSTSSAASAAPASRAAASAVAA